MALRVKAVTIEGDTLKTPVIRVTDVVGINVDTLNVRVELDGAGAGAAGLPDEIPIEVRVQEPKLRRDNMSSLAAPPFKTTAERNGNAGIYRVSVDPSDLRPLLKPADSFKKVATVVRDGGTSAVKFRSRLANNGWAVRGAAKQTATGDVTAVTGDVHDEQPDARTLFLAGGVEVVEASVPASAGLTVNPLAKSWVFIRSPADVFFYSGHGHWQTCNLLIDQGHDLYGAWLKPEKIVDSWKGLPIDVLIINGCAVIGHFGMSTDERDDDPSPKLMAPCGRRWRKLLKKEGGPLTALLGYRGTAPLDSGGGDQIALEMAQAMIDGLKNDWGSYAEAWIKINARHQQTWTAAAMDDKGYRYINLEKEPAAHTHGARPLPGFKSDIREGTPMGPGPMPEDWSG